MLSRVALRRDEGWSKVASRSESTKEMGLPLVVLQGTFYALKVEMQQALDIELWNTCDQSSAPRRFDGAGFQKWRETVRSMALVHSSWHALARRLLGLNIVVRRHGISPNLAQNPLFGGWTQELHVSFDELTTEDSSYPQNSLLLALCARIPNVRLVSFSLPEDSAQSTLLIPIICKGLSLLTATKEVLFLGKEAPLSLIPLLSETHHPTLRTIRFGFQTRIFESQSHILPQLLSPLISLPTLCFIHVAFAERPQMRDSHIVDSRSI